MGPSAKISHLVPLPRHRLTGKLIRLHTYDVGKSLT
jgi:hypothetical protein